MCISKTVEMSLSIFRFQGRKSHLQLLLFRTVLIQSRTLENYFWHLNLFTWVLTTIRGVFLIVPLDFKYKMKKPVKANQAYFSRDFQCIVGKFFVVWATFLFWYWNGGESLKSTLPLRAEQFFKARCTRWIIRNIKRWRTWYLEIWAVVMCGHSRLPRNASD